VTVPPKVEPTPAKFALFTRRIQGYGFERVGSKEVLENLRRQRFRDPRRRKGKEVGFKFGANGLEVWVWTTWLEEQNTIRDEDLGFVIITMDGKRRYTARPALRTENFFLTLLRRAWLAKWRVVTRPACNVCGTFMVIASKKKNPKQKFWKRTCYCIRSETNPRTLNWDFNFDELPLRAKAWHDAERRDKARNRKRNKELGIVVIPASVRRRNRNLGIKNIRAG